MIAFMNQHFWAIWWLFVLFFLVLDDFASRDKK